MSKIVAVGDIHEGINFGYNIDAETGISKRALDIHINFKRTAQFAIENKARLFIVLGDMFDRTHVSPTFREMIRRDIIEPLEAEEIDIWILAGNHDQPHGEKKGTSIDDFRGYEHVKVFRKPAVEKVEVEQKSVGFIIVPYLHPEHIANLVKEKEGSDISREQMFLVGQRLLKQWIANRCHELDSDLKILLGHYYLEGAKLRETASPEVLPDEFKFTKDMLPEELDLAVFGHVHLHQAIGDTPELIYTGAIERIDWGERDDPKGFVVISPNKDKLWKFEELNVRDMVKLALQIDAEDDPTQKILKAIPEDVEGKMFRLEIELEEGARERISEASLTEKLKGAFYYDVKWKESSKDKLGYAEFTMNPYQLFRTFIKINYGEHPKYEQILKEGENILSEVLG